MVIATHSSNITGKILPVELIGEFCCENNLMFIIDACQSAGSVPIDLGKIKCDVLCSSGHKSLYGPQGTGIMVINSAAVIDTLMQEEAARARLTMICRSCRPSVTKPEQSIHPELQGFVWE